MADFFGKLKQSIDKGTKVIGAKSSSLIDSNKVKSEISALKKSKTDTLLVIGTKVYESDKITFTLDAIAEELIAITNIDTQIQLKEFELEKIKEDSDEKLQQINKAFSEPKETVEEAAEEVEEAVEDLKEATEEAVEELSEDIDRNY